MNVVGILAALSVFVVFIPLNVYYLRKHIVYTRDISAMTESAGTEKDKKSSSEYDKDVVNLFIRLVGYSIVICVAVSLFLFVHMDGYHQRKVFKKIGKKYIECILLEYQFSLTENERQEIIKNGDILEYLDDKCILDPDNAYPELTAYHLTVIIGIFLIGVASVVFSCSLKKFQQWKYAFTWTMRCGRKSRDNKHGAIEMTNNFSNSSTVVSQQSK